MTFVREDPPGSGPLAGIGAGLAEVSTPLVGVIAADMPFALPVVAEALSRSRTTAGRRHVASWIRSIMDGIDDAGVGRGRSSPSIPRVTAQLLCAAYRTDALRAALDWPRAAGRPPVRALLPALRRDGMAGARSRTG